MAIVRCALCDELGIYPDREDGQVPEPTGCLYDPAAVTSDTCRDVRWYAVHTRPNVERKAYEELQRLGYRTFYPHRIVRRYRRRPKSGTEQRINVTRPQFSRYIFIGLVDHQGLYQANEATHVATVVYGPEGPLRIPGQVMAHLMEICNARGVVDYEDRTKIVFDGLPGEAAQFGSDHPLSGLLVEIATVEDMDRTGEIGVWLDMFGARREVQVPIAALHATKVRFGT
jgi:transcription antitermination factor NusG